MIYEIDTNMVSFNLPIDSLKEFKGEHLLKITLIDELGSTNEYKMKVYFQDLESFKEIIGTGL